MGINDVMHVATRGTKRGHGSPGDQGDFLREQQSIPPHQDDVLYETATGRFAPPRWHVPEPHSWQGRRMDLVVLASSAPVLIAALRVAGVGSGTGFQVVAGWSLAQLLVVMILLGTHPRDTDPRGRSAADGALAHAPVDRSVEADTVRAADRLHEVRATMAGIGITHRLLREGGERISLADRARLELIYDREISRLERLLLDDARVDDEIVDVRSVVSPVVESLRLRGQRITWKGTHAQAAGRGDDVAEIVHILLHNAMRHAPGSDVSMQVEATPTQVLLRVTDDGPGVPDALAASLFERGIRRPDSPGEGIGLQIARRLAREMGGDLQLDPSSHRRGATFILTLRACAEAAPCLTRQG